MTNHSMLRSAVLLACVLAVLLAALAPLAVDAAGKQCYRIPHGRVCVAPGYRSVVCDYGYRWTGGTTCVPARSGSR